MLAIGFLLALVFAWAFELTPDGIKLTQSSPISTIAASNGLDYALIVALLVVAAATVWDRMPSPSADNSAATATTDQTLSIAVLPFADMSANHDQEYFGDGIAEELLNELTRLDGLRVAGRTSSFAYRDQTENLRTIGESLAVSSILEGSVRKDGNRIRVTAQLINAADGYHLWSETYDREVTDLFAIQEDIALSVAGALGVTLGVGDVNAFRGAGTRNIAAYDAYLEAMAIRGTNADESILLLERATQLDPAYAVAWAQLGLRTAGLQWSSDPGDAPALLERAYGFVRRAVDLDPESAQSLALLGTLRYAQKDWIGGEEAHRAALTLLEDRPILIQYGNLLMRAGRSTAARAQFEAAAAADSSNTGGSVNSWQVSVALGRYAEAREIATRFAGTPDARSIGLTIALNEGGADVIRAALAAMPPTAISTAALYAPALRNFDSPAAVLDTLRRVHENSATQWPSKLHDIAQLAAYFRDPEFALQAIGEEVRNTTVRLQSVWSPLMSEVRRLPRFKDLVADLNLVAYWRASGWADTCRLVGADDFTCR